MPTPKQPQPASSKPVPRFRLRVTVGEVIAIGPGKITLLEAIAQTGSITNAAKSLDMSYRRAWLLLDELNRALKKPAIDSAQGGQSGGGSVVTPAGHELINLYRHIEATAAAACQDDLKRLVKMLTA
jgi:molybdate transport system regulatory protein